MNPPGLLFTITAAGLLAPIVPVAFPDALTAEIVIILGFIIPAPVAFVDKLRPAGSVVVVDVEDGVVDVVELVVVVVVVTTPVVEV